MNIALKNLGKAACLGTAFAVIRDDVRIGTAYRHDSGPRRGCYRFGSFSGSRAMLLAFAAKA